MAIVAVMVLTELAASYRAVPAPSLRTEVEVANKLFDVVLRMANPKIAAKFILYALADLGVESASTYLVRKFAAAAGNLDGTGQPGQVSDCVQQLAQLINSCNQQPSQPGCTCGQHQPQPVCTCGQQQAPRCPNCQKPLA